MYRGKIVEQGNTRDIFEKPSHPYVKGLIACRPTLDTQYQTLPTVDDFLKTEIGKDGSFVLSEHPDSVERLGKLKEKSENLHIDNSVPLLKVSALQVHFHTGGLQYESGLEVHLLSAREQSYLYASFHFFLSVYLVVPPSQDVHSKRKNHLFRSQS